MECRGTSLYLEAQHSVVTYTKGSGVWLLCLILMVSTQAHLLQVVIHRIEKWED